MIERDALLKARLAERIVEIPGVGELRIRSLSGAEVTRIAEYKNDVAAGEEFVLCRGVIDPVLTPPDVRAWRDAAPHEELASVLTAIFELSGLGEAALKEAAKSFRDGPDETS